MLLIFKLAFTKWYSSIPRDDHPILDIDGNFTDAYWTYITQIDQSKLFDSGTVTAAAEATADLKTTGTTLMSDIAAARVSFPIGCKVPGSPVERWNRANEIRNRPARQYRKEHRPNHGRSNPVCSILVRVSPWDRSRSAGAKGCNVKTQRDFELSKQWPACLPISEMACGLPKRHR